MDNFFWCEDKLIVTNKTGDRCLCFTFDLMEAYPKLNGCNFISNKQVADYVFKKCPIVARYWPPIISLRTQSWSTMTCHQWVWGYLWE
jgi:hypothetical protein